MWADNEAEVDLLGFDFLVDALVVAVTEPRLLPLTVGVLGDWGSGKSSLMRMAEQRFGARNDTVSPPEGECEPRIVTASFSPWLYEDYEDVKVALMNVVLDALQQRVPAERETISRLRGIVRVLKRAGTRMGRAGAAVAPVVAPILLQTSGADQETVDVARVAVGAISVELTGALDALPRSGAVTEDTFSSVATMPDFRREFRELTARIEGLDALVVFIDDLDRCLPETIVDTFEAIRLFLNGPKTAYVLALNQDVVESAIDSRYPDLRRADGAGIGRDYIEKMLQLKIVVPPLSPPEAETYVNLLFAELHLEVGQFAKVAEIANHHRATSALSVAFNAGIAQTALGEVPAELAADLVCAANITPVLGQLLRGNPRQLKRFLNDLLLKHRSAARRGVDLELPILAKLMVLENQHHVDFQRLFDWSIRADGVAPELREAEARARGTDVVEDHAESAPTSEAVPDAGGAREVAMTTSAQVSTDVAAWADRPHIKSWLGLDPPFAGRDLRPYFTYSRDRLQIGGLASRLPAHLQALLGGLLSDVDVSRRNQYGELTKLDAGDRAQIVEALLDRAEREPGGVPMTASLELAEVQPDLLQTVCERLLRIPPTSVPILVALTATRRLPIDDPGVAALLDRWRGASNAHAVAIDKARASKGKR